MNKLFLSIIAVVVAIAVALVFQASQVGTSTVMLPSVLSTQTNSNLQRIRVAGRVAAGEVDYKVEPAIELKFTIEDPGSNQDKHPGTIKVVYPGIKPDMFATGRDVIIDGDFNGGVLLASKLLTQCPSKYEPPKANEMYK